MNQNGLSCLFYAELLNWLTCTLQWKKYFFIYNPNVNLILILQNIESFAKNFTLFSIIPLSKIFHLFWPTFIGLNAKYDKNLYHNCWWHFRAAKAVRWTVKILWEKFFVSHLRYTASTIIAKRIILAYYPLAQFTECHVLVRSLLTA